jgi:hypothetical protein
VLLDGLLVSRGILERAALERVLLSHDTFRINQLFPLLSCIAAEMWARSAARAGSPESPRHTSNR